MDKLSYALGLVIGHNLKEMGVDNLNGADFAQAVADVLAGNATAMTNAEAQQIVATYMQEKEAEKGKAAREAGEKFLAENAKKEGVVVLPSGLQYVVLTEGSGRKPSATDNVKCHYEGRLTDGTVFDSSYRRGEPAVFPLNGVIAGWTEGVRRSQVPLMHPLQPCLRRARSRRKHSSLRSPRVRCGANRSNVISIKNNKYDHEKNDFRGSSRSGSFELMQRLNAQSNF